MTLAKRIRDYRYIKGWGPDELAARASISRTALYQIESGKTELPRAATLRRIAEALEIPTDALLGPQMGIMGLRPQWLGNSAGSSPAAPAPSPSDADHARFRVDDSSA